MEASLSKSPIFLNVLQRRSDGHCELMLEQSTDDADKAVNELFWFRKHPNKDCTYELWPTGSAVLLTADQVKSLKLVHPELS